MCNNLNLKILLHIFTIIYLIMIFIIMRGEKFVAHLDGFGGTPVAHHCVTHQSYSRVPASVVSCSRSTPSASGWDMFTRMDFAIGLI
jgi:hypothetical protein